MKWVIIIEIWYGRPEMVPPGMIPRGNGEQALETRCETFGPTKVPAGRPGLLMWDRPERRRPIRS